MINEIIDYIFLKFGITLDKRQVLMIFGLLVSFVLLLFSMIFNSAEKTRVPDNYKSGIGVGAPVK